ncbi:protein white-like isoform X1 [Ruditapes philippinarum]|uniref:protein white-like isoform X1 n=1 Tax=Ruditapes philippinarum TaxID=129788 RepID=UPI00295B657B|nr:protein white-like isoform X1 [Ruditapes philippinarum]
MLKSMMKKWQDSVICMTRRNVEEKADGVTLSWDNINVHVKPKRRICCRRQDSIDPPNQILKNVYGSIKPGTLLAIIGASGSGKTTLLNTLTTRVDTNSLSITGDIRVNGKVAGTNIRDISAYVRQDDMFIATMTVKEHLTFRALLRMDRTLSKDKRLARVQEVIHELGLQKCMNNMIGDPGRIKGISGGEMRRLSFASEILNDPPLLFCDEPTSGLDSFMAESIVQNLRSMTNKGKTVMCTIHQPSSEVFFLFNQILIMAEGRVAFLGGINDALNFFSSVGKPCPQNYNPCDFFIASMAVVPGNEAECRSNVKTICDEFEKTTNAIEMKNENHPKEINSSSRSSLLVSESSDRYGSPWYEQFAAVLTRSWKTTLREPMVMRVRLVQTIVLSIVLGLIYLQLNHDQEGVMNINGVIFLILINMTVTNMLGVLNSFPLETPIFKREYGIGLYRVDIYFISKTLAELPSYLIIPVIFSAIAYWMIGLYNTLEAFLVFTAVIVLVSNISVSFGYIVSAGTNSVTTALAIAPPTLIPLVMFGGFFLNSDSVPVYFIWLEYLSWFKYSNELLMVNQWDDVDMLSCDSNSTSPVDSCHFHNGKQVILYLNYSKDNLWFNIGLLLAMLIVYRIIAFILLLVKARSSKT